MTIDPRFMNFPEWASRTGDLVLPLGYVPQKPDEKNWQQFARSLGSIPAMGSVGGLPKPEFYGSWQAWGMKANEYLSLLGL